MRKLLKVLLIAGCIALFCVNPPLAIVLFFVFVAR